MAVVNNAKFANFFRSHMTADVTAVATSFDIVDVTGLPTITGDQYFYLVLNQLNTGFKEIVQVTDVTGNTLTVVRGVDGTSALTFSHGDRVEQWFNAALLDDLLTEIRTEVDKIVIPTAEVGIDQGDVSVVNSVAFLINAAAGSPLHIKLPSGGANGGEYNAATPLTVPASVLLDMENGSFLTGTWTLLCQLWAPINKIFDGPSGTITVIGLLVKETFPQWWMDDFGDDDDPLYDWTPALLVSHLAPGAVRFARKPQGNYRLATNFAPGNTTTYLFDFSSSKLFLDNITFTNEAAIEAPRHPFLQIIECSNCIFGASSINQIWYPEWLGIQGLGAPSGAAFDELVNGLMGGNGTVRFALGSTYFLDDTVTVPAGVTIEVLGDARIKLGFNRTFTMNGRLDATAREVFFGAGGGPSFVAGDFGGNAPEPEWFGDANITNNTVFNDDPNTGGVIGYLGKIFSVLNKTQFVDFFHKMADHEAATGWESVMGLGIIDFTDADTTPSVKGYKNFRSGNSSDTTITNFDDGYPGKRIHMIAGDTNTFIDFTSPNLLGLVSSSQRLQLGDSLTALLDDAGVWHCFIERRSGGATVDWDSGWTLIGSGTPFIALDQITGDDGFSNVTKNDPVTGVTPASGLVTDFIFTTVDTPGYANINILIAQREDIGAGFQDRWLDLGRWNASSDDERGSGINLITCMGICAKGTSLFMAMSTEATNDTVVRIDPNTLTEMNWVGTDKGMAFNDSLIRIQMTSG